MARQRDQLIAALSAEVRPVVGPGRHRLVSLAWVAACLVFSSLAILLVAPFRSGFHTQLWESPQLLIEILLGLATILAMTLAAWRSGLPMPRAGLYAGLRWPLVLLVAWLAIQGFGLFHAALPPSMAGKREYCWLETFLYGIPCFALGCWWVNRMWPLHPRYSGALLGFAAGLTPAVLMQLACMFDPGHGLTHHSLPGLCLALLGALLGSVCIRRP